MNKKGISPLIASILLIVFILVISVLVMNWMRGSVERQMEGGEEQAELVAKCNNAIISIDGVDWKDGNIYDIVVSNTGTEGITGEQIIITGSTGIEAASLSVPIDSGESKVVTTGALNVGTPEKVQVIPTIAEGACEASGASTTNIRDLTT